MKIIIISSALLCLFFLSCSQENAAPTATPETTSTEEQTPLIAKMEAPVEDLSPTVYYVNAPSGLSLRQATNLTSKKLMTLPYGAQLTQIGSPENTEMTIDGIEGEMIAVAFQGAKGFVFNGYLSQLAPPVEDESVYAYAKRIHTDAMPVKVNKVRNDKGAAFGETTTISLPAKSWREAYAISKQLFDLPHAIAIDFNSKDNKAIFENRNKRLKTLTDEVVVTRDENNNISTMVYTYALKTYGRSVQIEKTPNGFTITEIDGTE